MTSPSLPVSPAPWSDRSPSWPPLLQVLGAALQGPGRRAQQGGQGGGVRFPIPVAGSHPLGGKGSACFELLPYWFGRARVSLILAIRVDRAHYTDGEGQVLQPWSDGPWQSPMKGPWFWCLTVSPHLGPASGLPSTEMGAGTPGVHSHPRVPPVFALVSRDRWSSSLGYICCMGGEGQGTAAPKASVANWKIPRLLWGSWPSGVGSSCAELVVDQQDRACLWGGQGRRSGASATSQMGELVKGNLRASREHLGSSSGPGGWACVIPPSGSRTRHWP